MSANSSKIAWPLKALIGIDVVAVFLLAFALLLPAGGPPPAAAFGLAGSY